MTLLPTPTTEPLTGNGHARNLGAEVLLPTPVVNDMGAGKTPDAWDAWTERLKSSHGNGNGHGDSLAIEALRMLPTPTTRDVKGRNQRDDDTCLTGALLPTPTTEPTTGNGHARNLGCEAKMLPTPRATDGTKGGPNQRGPSGDLMLPSAVHTLLPTPIASDGQGGPKRIGADGRSEADHGAQMRDLAPTLLPTPTCTQRGPDANQDQRADAGPNLHNAVIDFGVYSPAINRWVPVVGRLAPSPTEGTGKTGAQRLSPRFVEWMMGLPDGHVTGVDITRNEQLKALGNGVVPQQCAAAIRHLLGVRASVLAGVAA